MKVLLLYGAQLDVQNQVRPASLHRRVGEEY